MEVLRQELLGGLREGVSIPVRWEHRGGGGVIRGATESGSAEWLHVVIFPRRSYLPIRDRLKLSEADPRCRLERRGR